MDLRFITSVLIIIPFVWAFYYLLKRRKYFRSLYPFGFAALFLAIARMSDLLVQTSHIDLADLLGVSRVSLNTYLALVADFSDVIGVILLVFGFVRAIESLHAEEERIETLEALLPLCAWCKRVRTEEGIWKPVEKYLQDKGAPEATHGICPDCAARLLHNKRGDWTTEEEVPGEPMQASSED